MNPKSSVSLRLIVLIFFQVLMIIGIATYSYKTLHKSALATEQMYRFQLLPIADLAKTLQQTENYNPQTPQRQSTESASLVFDQLDKFSTRYAEEWHVTYGRSEDAREFAEDLKEAGKEALRGVEFEAFENFSNALKVIKEGKNNPENIKLLRQGLSALLEVNIQYAKIGDEQNQDRTRSAKKWLFTFSLIAILLCLLVGLYIHWTIAPRIRRLVAKVEKFREFGVNDKIIEKEKDEITILTRAIDLGFNSIAEREKDRDRFLSVISHELKTPLTSIYGFTSFLQSDEDIDSMKDSIGIINRQAWRLNRLIEDLFLSEQALTGKLTLKPRTFSLSQLVKKVSIELEEHLQNQKTKTLIAPDIQITADESILEHAIWAILTCGATLSKQDATLSSRLNSEGGKAMLEVQLVGSKLTYDEIEALFHPFSTVEFERGSELRSAVSLHLSRAVAHLHHGTIRITTSPDTDPTLTLVLPTTDASLHQAF